MGDLDGDGLPEIVVGTNEEYGGEPNGFFAASQLLTILMSLAGSGLGLGDFDLETGGRLYAVHHDGNLHAGGPLRAGWPVRVPMVVGGLLPTVATGSSLGARAGGHRRQREAHRGDLRCSRAR